MNSKQIHRLATRPAEYAKYLATGRLPQGVRPASALISLLEQISLADRVRILGVVIDSSLGYAGSRQFFNAERALKWVKPDAEVFGSFPAQSWQDKRFLGPLYIDDLVAKAQSVPSDFLQRYARLCKPAEAGQSMHPRMRA
jgi:hypothetical protein